LVRIAAYSAEKKSDTSSPLELTTIAFLGTSVGSGAATEVGLHLPEGVNVFACPEPIRKPLRTSNLCEALNKQIRRRTRVAAIFPNPESCLRLVSAILMEISEAWETSKAYLYPNLLR
jgi:transposase-like protein